MRNLDMTALRAFVAVADCGGVTRAAGLLNLTQSAVSMQLKRLEQSLDRVLLDRSARRISLTAEGEQLLGYGRKMLALNDEIYARMTDHAFQGEITFGVPPDIVYPHTPGILQRFAAEFPRVKVQLISSNTYQLKRLYAHGDCDMILTTERDVAHGGETLTTQPLVWVGAPNGVAWKSRPLRLAFEHGNLFRGRVQEALDHAGIPWEMSVESEFFRSIEASVTADLAIHASIRGSLSVQAEEIEHGGKLPDLADININLYVADQTQTPLAAQLADLVRRTYRAA